MAYQVIGIGNAVMDVISTASDARLAELGIQKGIMQLIERDRAEELTHAGNGARLVPGGSVANTLTGLGRMGLSTAFIGRVAADDLGRAYAHEMGTDGTDFVNAPVEAGLPTSRSIIFVTPDGERSMNTYLGISAELDGDDVDAGLFSGGSWLFLEGYLFDKPKGKAAFLKAAEACHAAGGQAGIALSDPFCVDRHRADFRRLVAGPMDYVIGNLHEWQALYQVEDLEEALRLASADCGTVICTRSGEDAILIRGGERVTAPVHRVTPVDATGAGDQFAAGLIYGLATGKPLAVAGRMGCIAAAEVITHLGARPEADVMALFRAEGLV
ncbi:MULTISPECIES: adenosine kinase [unclassified Paracoccus (in: a-proteobacteria)]|uniref:adenosine kinase n=1 Tax=unclassified Paracoccus (in: a-proteobacteria) TaxID=2688777 RepID=UPI0016040178|nr:MULTISPECIES: adenosine kinase [unclassified Paracoccus (in: a-proteobacteria)]MBB1490978.1 adenosine kinase [Paracoccus sp. MC1854]MBB1498883.1 adenosine kinase [Paracoccus sp. MC1862]QQO45174.1 adenosine kinase [Paracoccus sp. MC1862]